MTALAALIIGAWFAYHWDKEAAYEAMGEMFGFEDIQREIAEKGMQ